MSTSIRAKFRCTQETKHIYRSESRTYKFEAIYDSEIPEDVRFAKATPTGSLEMTVDNPSARFVIGDYYYLDFTPVDAELVTQ